MSLLGHIDKIIKNVSQIKEILYQVKSKPKQQANEKLNENVHLSSEKKHPFFSLSLAFIMFHLVARVYKVACTL